jgi:PAS domain S-box-containing protein
MSKKENLGDLITENIENAEELSAVDKKSALNKDDTEKKTSKLILANKENATELRVAYKTISTQKKEIKKQAADLIRADKEKEKRKADLLSTKKELVLAAEKAKLVVGLTLVNKELTIQITERIQIEKSLFESEERFQLLFDKAPLGYQALDFNGNFMEVNQTWIEILGYTREEVIGKWFGDFLSPAYQDGFRKRFPIFKAQGHIHSEFEMVHKNGSKLFIAFEGRIGYDNNGEFKQTHCILQDITELKKLDIEKELNYQFQEALNKILSISVENISLEESLNRILITVISLSVLSLENKGAVLLTEEGQNILMLKTSHNLSNEIQTMCAQVPFGHCLCGRAATTRQIQFADCVDERHENSYEKIVPHGHYNVPILTSDKVLGVIVVYLAENHKQEKYEHDFLLAVADILSGLIQRKHADEELKKANSELENLHNNLDEAVFSVDMIHNKMLHASIAHKTVFGHSPAEFFDNPQLWYEIVVPEDKPIVDASYPVLFSGKNLHHEFRIAHPDGQIRWIGAKMNPTLDPSGKLIRIDGIASDITDRKKTEEVILKNEAKQGKLVANVGDVIVIIDKNGINQYKSPNITALFGWKPEELVGKSIWDLIHPDDLESSQKFVDTIAKKPNAKGTTETRYRRKDGRYVWIEITLVNLLSDPDVLGILGNYHEITERKQAELELIKAKEKAEESDRLKSAFLANMSHEIRTPMNGILGFADLLKEPELSGEQQQEYIEIIEKSGARMLNIISDIVSISKIESGTMNTYISDTNINGQTQYVYKLLKLDAEKKKLAFILKNGLPDQESILKTDKEKFIGILSNLVKNAIKYTDEGTIEFGYDLVETSCSVETLHATSLHQPSLQFYVKDTGIGIPKDRQEAIFERFIQADIEDKMARQGAGLGLAISKAYVEMLGGKIWVESEPNCSSTFYFSIPYNNETKEKPVKSNLSPDQEDKIQLKIFKVLIVEDDETSEIFLKKIVRRFSQEVFTAKNGLEAVDLCRQNPDIDLILMDIQMSEMNGYMATQQIRQFNKDVIIIAQTAFGLESDREKSIEAGCNDYISKPIRKENLMVLMNKYFGEQEYNN